MKFNLTGICLWALLIISLTTVFVNGDNTNNNSSPTSQEESKLKPVKDAVDDHKRVKRDLWHKKDKPKALELDGTLTISKPRLGMTTTINFGKSNTGRDNLGSANPEYVPINSNQLYQLGSNLYYGHQIIQALSVVQPALFMYDSTNFNPNIPNQLVPTISPAPLVTDLNQQNNYPQPSPNVFPLNQQNPQNYYNFQNPNIQYPYNTYQAPVYSYTPNQPAHPTPVRDFLARVEDRWQDFRDRLTGRDSN